MLPIQDISPLYQPLKIIPQEKKLQKITTSKIENNRTYKGFNFFEKADQDVLVYLTSGEFNISGFRSKDLKKRFKNYSSFKISRILKRLRVIGLIKKMQRHTNITLQQLEMKL